MNLRGSGYVDWKGQQDDPIHHQAVLHLTYGIIPAAVLIDQAMCGVKRSGGSGIARAETAASPAVG